MQILTNHIKAIQQFAAVQDIRYYLNGVYFQDVGGKLRLVATNGSILAAIDTGIEWEGDVRNFIVPAEAINAAAKHKGTTVSLNTSNGQFTLSTTIFKPTDGIFPDYTRVIPKEHSNAPAQFNPEFMMCFAKAAKALMKNGQNRLYVFHNGANSAAVVIEGYPQFVGVIMPYIIKDKNGKTVTPEFPKLA